MRSIIARVACVAPYVRSRARRGLLVIPDLAVEDIVQETYLAIWRKLGTYRGESKLETWACGFALIELHRWRERDARIGERRIESAEEPSESPAPIDDSSERIDLELERMGDPSAAIIRMKHVEELTFDEIGERLGMSPNTAKSLHYRGLARLRERLRSLGEELLG